jgi:hypothetical protein
MIRKLPKKKFVVHCKRTKYYDVRVEADSEDETKLLSQSLSKVPSQKHRFVTIHDEVQVMSVSDES